MRPADQRFLQLAHGVDRRKRILPGFVPHERQRATVSVCFSRQGRTAFPETVKRETQRGACARLAPRMKVGGAGGYRAPRRRAPPRAAARRATRGSVDDEGDGPRDERRTSVGTLQGFQTTPTNAQTLAAA
jgi:hypothetical protein